MTPETIQGILSENETLHGDVKSLKEENVSLQSENVRLKDELAYLRRQIYGQKREKYIPTENQLTLSKDWHDEEREQETEKVSYERHKPKGRRNGRDEIPAHIPRDVEVLEPDCDTSGMEKLGEKATEQLEYKPPEFRVRRIVRPFYADESSDERKIICAKLPPLCIDKGKAGPSLVAHTLVSKCEDHLPLYRVLNQVKRDCGMGLPKSSVEDWFNAGAFWAGALVRRMEEIMMAGHYVQIDESYLKVMVQPTGGKSTRGYMWVRHSPELKIAVFNFNLRQNSKVAAKLIGDDFEGIVQSDGLLAYDFLEQRKKIKHGGCNGHARRYFEKSLGNDRVRADYALKVYRNIFKVEKEAKEKGLSPEERLRLRKERSAPLMAEFKEWLEIELHKVRPKDKIGKAFTYALGRWKELTLFLEDGMVEISNNLIENVIRLLALGRRNWLFAGSPKGAERLAAVYSVILTCKLHEVNSFKYLSDVLRRLPLRKNGDIDDLLPWNWAEPVEEN